MPHANGKTGGKTKAGASNHSNTSTRRTSGAKNKAHTASGTMTTSSKMSAEITALLPSMMAKVEKRLSSLEGMSPMVLVDRKDATKSTKDSAIEVVNSMLARRSLLERVSFRHTKNSPLRVLIVDRATVTSSANTALTTVTSLTPLAASDATSFATVYDDARCVSGETRFIPSAANGGVPASALVRCAFALAYDPSNSGVYTTVQQPLEARYHWGPAYFTGNGLPQTTNGKGHLSLHWKPQYTLTPGGSSFVIGGNWTSSTDTGAIVGYLKPYIEAAGAAIATQFDMYTMYILEFAYRT